MFFHNASRRVPEQNHAVARAIFTLSSVSPSHASYNQMASVAANWKCIAVLPWIPVNAIRGSPQYSYWNRFVRANTRRTGVAQACMRAAGGPLRYVVLICR